LTSPGRSKNARWPVSLSPSYPCEHTAAAGAAAAVLGYLFPDEAPTFAGARRRRAARALGEHPLRSDVEAGLELAALSGER